MGLWLPCGCPGEPQEEPWSQPSRVSAVLTELMQTEFHHIRTLKIMGDVYGRGMVTELLFEQPMVEKLFPCLDELISIHSQFFQKILERKKECAVDKSDNFLIRRIGDVLVGQVRMLALLRAAWLCEPPCALLSDGKHSGFLLKLTRKLECVVSTESLIRMLAVLPPSKAPGVSQGALAGSMS